MKPESCLRAPRVVASGSTLLLATRWIGMLMFLPLYRSLAAQQLCPPAKSSSGTSAQLTAKVDQYIQPLVTDHDFSGVVLLARGGRILVHKAYGCAEVELGIPNTTETRFELGSISKHFTAVGILILEQQNRLSVSDPLSKYIPDFPDGDQITLQLLLQHRAGIIRDLPGVFDNTLPVHTLAEIVDLIKRQPLSAAPGQQFSYSNAGYQLLAYVIERVSGQSLDAFLQAEIFAKLGMKETGVYPAEEIVRGRARGYVTGTGNSLINAYQVGEANMFGAGGIISTAYDMYLWDRALYTDRILVSASRAALFNQLEDGYGYGLIVSTEDIAGKKRRKVGHDGFATSYVAAFDRFVDDDATVIYLGNIRSGAPRLLRPALSRILFGQEVKVPALRGRPASVSSDILQNYAGTYEYAPGRTFEIVLRHDTLYISTAGPSAAGLTPISADSFFFRDMYTTLKFPSSATGPVPELLWIEPDAQYPCKRVK